MNLYIMETYRCRCGTTLAVYEGERRVKCGVCGEINNIPSTYWQSEQPKQVTQFKQPDKQPDHRTQDSLNTTELRSGCLFLIVAITLLCIFIL